MDRPELSEQDRIVAAVEDDRIVGVQPVTIDRPFYVAPLERTIDLDGAYFWGLYVLPEWRRRGIATALVTRALSFVAEETTQTCVQTLIGIDNVPSKRVLTGVGFERKRARSYYRLFGLQHRG
ncbi:GNAT family N-acetyltransferase [Halopiger djelfimassiliensis]|uniref:GNAT family N-acetyltransferase n=1 Tax=Halopiger djelfimassiliensis TaxID=1293047 RepID=UPI00067798F5|nr:GNAT family N-acetyltransferase [Halopiger djelfimassiliensis]